MHLLQISTLIDFIGNRAAIGCDPKRINMCKWTNLACLNVSGIMHGFGQRLRSHGHEH